MIRVGFGLSSAPKIMAAILKKIIWSKDKRNEETGSSYIDILVDESVARAEKVQCHLETYGLMAKPSESLD